MIRGSDMIVDALEGAGVDQSFGAPGEEKPDLLKFLRTGRRPPASRSEGRKPVQ